MMTNRNLNFEDLDSALILISYDTVSTEDENDGWSHTLLNDLIDGPENMLIPVLKNMERRSRRAARRSFFDNMFGF